MYDPDNVDGSEEVQKVTRQIEMVAKQQHLQGIRRDAFTDTISLCSTCKWSNIRRQASRNTRRMDCSSFTGPCPEDIVECTEYASYNSLSLSQMSEIATLINIEKPKRVGFSND